FFIIYLQLYLLQPGVNRSIACKHRVIKILKKNERNKWHLQTYLHIHTCTHTYTNTHTHTRSHIVSRRNHINLTVTIILENYERRFREVDRMHEQQSATGE
ncbi:unnamed protein product, partial [Ixodes pacificus]